MRLEDRPDVIGDDLGAAFVRMDAVRLVQVRMSGDTVEEKRHQQHALLARDVAVDAAERGGVLGP